MRRDRFATPETNALSMEDREPHAGDCILAPYERPFTVQRVEGDAVEGKEQNWPHSRARFERSQLRDGGSPYYMADGDRLWITDDEPVADEAEGTFTADPFEQYEKMQAWEIRDDLAKRLSPRYRRMERFEFIDFLDRYAAAMATRRTAAEEEGKSLRQLVYATLWRTARKFMRALLMDPNYYEHLKNEDTDVTDERRYFIETHS